MMHSVKYHHDPYKASGQQGGSNSSSNGSDLDSDPSVGIHSPYTATDPATTPMSTISKDSTTRSVTRKGRSKSSVKVIHIRYKDRYGHLSPVPSSSPLSSIITSKNVLTHCSPSPSLSLYIYIYIYISTLLLPDTPSHITVSPIAKAQLWTCWTDVVSVKM